MDTNRKYSRKREAILSELRSTKTHPSAEWLYERLKPSIPDLSLGTVYRNLALFRTNGDIISVGTVHGQERFDGDIRPHSHFICSRCGRVIDVDDLPEDPTLWNSIEKLTGGKVMSQTLIFKGLCDDCLQK